MKKEYCITRKLGFLFFFCWHEKSFAYENWKNHFDTYSLIFVFFLFCSQRRKKNELQVKWWIVHDFLLSTKFAAQNLPFNSKKIEVAIVFWIYSIISGSLHFSSFFFCCVFFSFACKSSDSLSLLSDANAQKNKI